MTLDVMIPSSFLSGCFVGTVVTAAVFYLATFDGRKRSFVDDNDDDDHHRHGDGKVSVSEAKSSPAKLLRQMNHRLFHEAKGATDIGKSSFFTRMIGELWDHIRIVAADNIQTSVEPYFVDMPPPVNTCRFTKIDLGIVPFKMNNIVVHHKSSSNDFVQWDFDFEWDSKCDIQITADYIGSFGIKEMKIFGRMSMIFKPLVNEIPVVSAISYSFLNLPKVDLTFTGLASVAEIGAIKQGIEDVIKTSMVSSCLPYRRIYKMSKGGGPNGFLDIYRPPVGVLKLNIESGRGFVIEKRLLAKDDIPDVFLNVSLGAVAPGTTDGIQKTKTIMDNCNPVWNEHQEYLLWDKGQEINIDAWDEDEGPLDPDDELGSGSVAVDDLLFAPGRRKEIPLRSNGRKTGEFITLSCSIDSWTSDLTSLQLDSKEKSIETDGICGLLVVIINRAFNLPVEKTTASTFVRTSFEGKEYKSKVIYDYPGYWDPLNPVYESAFTIPLHSTMSLTEDTRIVLELVNEPIVEDGTSTSIIIGSTTVSFWELKKHPQNTITETRSIDSTANGPSLEFRASLSGIIPSSKAGVGVTPGASSPTRALPAVHVAANGSNIEGGKAINFDVIGTLGTARVTVCSCRGLQIEANLFDFDVPDCYCVVSFGGDDGDESDDRHTFKTSVKCNNTNPTWNEHHDFPLDDHGAFLTVEVWDYDEDGHGQDTILGTTKTTIGRLLMAGGATELQLKKNGRMCGIFVSLQCDMVA